MLEWIGEAEDRGGATERRFGVPRGGATVPGVLWTPAAARTPAPLVLLGHGGGGHKRDESRTAYALAYAARGIAAAAIDGPFHGDRAPAPGAAEPGYGEAAADSMAADWRAALDALAALEAVDGSRVAYGGVSMGTMFGLPFVAADGRPRAAVLGLCGLSSGGGGVEDGLYARLAADAPRLRCPVLFVMQWDDELFPRADALALYDAIGSADKRLLANPGGHADAPPHVRAAAVGFLAAALLGPDPA